MPKALQREQKLPKARELSFSKKKILVTGGAGFIGYHLVRRLHSLHAETVVVDPFPMGVGAFDAMKESVQLVTMFFAEYLGHPSTDLSAFDIVFHLAGNGLPMLSVEKPAMDFEQNLVNTFRLLDALRTTGRPPLLVNMSSAAVYGNPSTMPIREDDPVLPMSPYGVSKLTGERYSAVFGSLYNIRTVNVRPFSVYGPGLRKQVVYDTMQKLRNDERFLELFGDGKQKRDFVYISDLIEALLLIASGAPGHGEAYNVASGKSTTIAELVDMICELQNVHPKRRYSGKTRPGEPERWEVDIERLRSLGFLPIVTLKEGLKETIEWFQKQPHP